MLGEPISDLFFGLKKLLNRLFSSIMTGGPSRKRAGASHALEYAPRLDLTEVRSAPQPTYAPWVDTSVEGNTTMKRQVLCSLVLTGLLATGGMMYAQEPGSAPQDQSAPQAEGGGMGHHGGGRMMDPDARLAHMTKRYKLTADQQSQIKPILQDEQQQMQSLRGDTSASRDDKMAKMKGIHDASTQKIEAVLTDQQKQKFEADQQKMQERRAQHMQGGPGGPPPDGGAPPPQQ